ncbi:hypothetical protein DesLBE_5101 [Desulfitobacterium sp. LBE]|nr:hypothetical protein DesLBE_5101 [Desulfitobacterium sp. LBE]
MATLKRPVSSIFALCVKLRDPDEGVAMNEEKEAA